MNILGQLNTVVKFSNSKVTYASDFLVSDNIQYECVLGWDFINRHKLSFHTGPGKGYFLVGRHGKTSIRDKEPTTANLAGVTHSRVSRSSTDRLLCQSTFQSNAVVALLESSIIPPRTEMILAGKLAKSANSKIGMIEPRSGTISDARQGFSLARVVVKPDQHRVVPLRVINMSQNPIELVAGENLADFCPLVESCSTTSHLPDVDVCGAVECNLSKTFIDKVNAVIDTSLTSDDRKRVQRLLCKYSDVFDETLSHTTITTHKINTGTSPPIKQAPRRLPYAHRDEAKRQIDDMLEQGVIRPSTSAWSSPIILVKKKSGELRFCVDYRKLNSVTVGHAHPLPRIDDILDSLGDSKYFTTLDLRSGYWQISVNEHDRQKTAFATSNGLYEFNRMPFGLSTAPATFQRTMDIVLSGLTYAICLCYLDDVIVFGRNIDEHCERLDTVLLRMREHNLRVKLSKCKIAARQVAFLGHVISQSGIQPDPAKIAAVRDIPRPQSIKDIRSFLGLAGYYRKFIPDFATVAAPLVRLTEKTSTFCWSDECENSFSQLKLSLCSAPVLCYPRFDREFILQTDASDFGVGAVLSQLDDNEREQVVAYASKALSARQQKFSATEKEAYAVVFGTQHFRVYLLGRHFTIVTDHNALRWLHSMEPKGRLARWVLDLQEFNFSVVHRAGRLHNNADALSRLVQTQPCEQVTNSSAASADSAEDSTDKTDIAAVVKTTVQVKLSHGRIATITFEGSKPLKTELMGTLVTNAFNDKLSTSSSNSSTRIPQRDFCSQEADTEMPNAPSCALSVNPSLDIVNAQQQDPCLSRLLEMKKRGIPKPSSARPDDPIPKIWYNHYNRLFLRDGLLVRSIGDQSPYPNYVIAVPTALRQTILQAVHDNPFAGHLGISRTEERVRKRFYWPGIRSDVENYVKKCTVCAHQTSPVNSNRAPIGNIAVGEPFTFWAMDYMGPLPETTHGNKHILVVVDHFTKWCEAFATPDQKASTVAPLLISRIFSRFGPPAVLHSDQGRNFESVLMHEICDSMGITKTRTTAYHPQGDGQTERQNRTLQNMLSSFVSNRRDDWDLWLDSVTFAYNTSKHDVLGVSPYEVVFGRAPRLPLELELGMPLSNPTTRNEYMHTLRSVFHDVRQIAKQQLTKVSEKRAGHKQRTNTWRPFREGQTVMLRRPKGWKLGSKWVGPYRILKRVGVNYKIVSQGGEGKVVHHDQLKLSYVPFQLGELVCPSREIGEFQVVDVEPQQEGNPRARPARLRQNIRPPNRYGYD